jgi:hypothetical protein
MDDGVKKTFRRKLFFPQFLLPFHFPKLYLPVSIVLLTGSLRQDGAILNGHERNGNARYNTHPNEVVNVV